MKTQPNNTIKFFIVVIGLAVIGIVLRELSHIFIPFIIAYFLFFVFSPLNNFFEKRKVPLFLIILLDIAVILFFIWLTSAFLFDSFRVFGDELPSYAVKLDRLVSSNAVAFGVTDPYFTEFSIERIISDIDYKLLAGGIFTSTFSLLGSIFFIVFFFVFVVSGHNTIYEALKKRFIVKKVHPAEEMIDKNNFPDHPDLESSEVNYHKKEEWVATAFKTITSQIQKYIIAKILINLAAGFSGFIVFTIFGIDFPVIWGVVIFLFNFIPAIGSAIALILPVLMTLVQFESFGYALLIMIIVIALQSVFFNVLEPAIIGKRLNLNPLVILFSVLIWGYIWGIVGMLLAVPLTAIIKIVISNSKSKDLNLFTDIISQE